MDIICKGNIRSRGNPTIEAEVTRRGKYRRQSRSSIRASTGKYEAVGASGSGRGVTEGKGVSGQLKIVNSCLAKAVIGMKRVRSKGDRPCSL